MSYGNQNQRQQNDGGALYPSGQKKNPKASDYWGFVVIQGRRFKVSGWKKTNDKGMFLSLSVEPDNKEAAPRPQNQYQPAPQPARNYPPVQQNNNAWNDGPVPNENDYGADPF